MSRFLWFTVYSASSWNL